MQEILMYCVYLRIGEFKFFFFIFKGISEQELNKKKTISHTPEYLRTKDNRE